MKERTRTSAAETRTLTERGVRSRTTLVAAARRIFEQEGFHDARLGDITALAGCSPGSFYHYFDNKEQILVAVFEAVDQEKFSHWRIDPDEPDESTLAAWLEAAHLAYFRAYRSNVRLRLLMEQVEVLDPQFRQQRRRRTRTFLERCTTRMVELKEAGLIDPRLDPAMTTVALSSMVARLAHHFYTADEGVDDERLAASCTRLCLTALGVGRPRASGEKGGAPGSTS